MKISDLDHMEEVSSASITGGSFTVTNWGPIGVQINSEISQRAVGVIAKNDASLTINVNFNDTFKVG